MRSLYDCCNLVIRALVTSWCYFFFVSGALLWGVLGIPLALVLSRFWPGVRDRFHDGTQLLLTTFIRLVPFVKLDVDGNRELSDRSRVLVVNHQSFLDPVVMLSIEPRLSGPARGYMFLLSAYPIGSARDRT